jgi:UrcA family protein
MTMRTLCLTTALLCLATATPGITKPIIIQDSMPPTTRVSYADLNIHSVAGRQALESRVRRAADSLCLENGNPDLARWAIEHDCYLKAIAGARPQIDAAVRTFAVVAAAATITVSVR